MKDFLINCIAIIIVGFIAGALSALGMEWAKTMPIWFIAFMVANRHYQRRTKENEEKQKQEQEHERLIQEAVMKEKIRKELKEEMQANQM